MKMNSEPGVILISGCLIGLDCNYKAQASSAYQEGLCLLIMKMVEKGFVFVPVCPEQLGGMPTPRIPSELQHDSAAVLAGQGRVVSREGTDVTASFLKGAEESLKLARLYRVKCAVLKAKSPSCGSKTVYDGTFSGRLINGKGVTAALLSGSDIRVLDECEFAEMASDEALWSLFLSGCTLSV